MTPAEEHRRRVEEVLAANGDLYVEADGYWVYGPRKPHQGFIEAHTLRAIADILDEKNAAWHAQVMKELGPPLPLTPTLRDAIAARVAKIHKRPADDASPRAYDYLVADVALEVINGRS